MERARRKRPFVLFASSLALIVLLAFLPIVILIGSRLLALVNDCSFVAGKVAPCTVAGFDLSSYMATVQYYPWMLFHSFPAGILAFFIWLIALVVFLIARRKNAQEAT